MDRRRRIDSNLPPHNNTNTNNSDSNFPHNPTTSLSPSDFLRNVQAAFKGHRMMSRMKPRRLLVCGETSKSSDQVVQSTASDEHLNVSLSARVQDSILLTKNMISARSVNHEHVLNMPPTISNKTNDEEIYTSVDAEKCQLGFGTGCANCNKTTSSFLAGNQGPLFDGPKKVQFALENNATHGSDDHMDSGIDNLLTHMDSLALIEMECDGSNVMECDGSNQLDVSTALSQDARHQNFQNFIQNDSGNNMTQSSVVGSSCATTMLLNTEYAPMLNSTTYCSRRQHNSFVAGEYSDIQDQPKPQVPMEPNYDNKMLTDCLGSLFPSAAMDPPHLERKDEPFKDEHGKDPSLLADRSTKGSTFVGVITDIQSQAPMTDPFSNLKMEPSKSEKKEKADANKSIRKKSYDPDYFFKVNGKLYQRLGKIGSGGSSEVHKVISQDCTIYALKKIMLKGRDYATAFGFCQEIKYLNKLRGKDHIIKLIDYEVTDKALLKEVMSGSSSNKDGKVKDDGYIYMVLEYGEIDLAHMLSHKWKELDKTKQTFDENWLRFYWKQILLAVKTIHEERIVHSDLKPANFLLVSGSLKLIDFGIAKAIMSDTTHIQRDSQVGTLSYMSPEAYMCNETDANGNVIKCGRPSDIWSLGCILYQMVYGRTPFADYKTFWAKFKVVTDPDHEIQYEPVSNPWLLDLMKNCLAWDRCKRWRIPELLQHPFLVPPIPSLEDRKCKLIQLVSDSCIQHPKALKLCAQLEQLLSNPLPDITTDESIVVIRRRAPILLYEMSKLCIQLKEQLEQPYY